MLGRRDFLRSTLALGGGTMLLGWPRSRTAAARPPMAGLSDPALQPKFVHAAPNALAPNFRFRPTGDGGTPAFEASAVQTSQHTGLVGPDGKTPVATTVWGYGPDRGRVSWPGPTFEVRSGKPVEVTWKNELLDAAGKPLPHLLPVDTSLHWAYALPGYEGRRIETDGVPIVSHLHGGHTRYQYDGNPEFFFGPGWKVRGPRWSGRTYVYDNDQPAGNLWYHDHTLGITRLNIYAGLAGFYFIRDDIDSGRPDNPLGLPAAPYELAYAIQDRMFRGTGELFYPAFPGDPFWQDFITEEGVEKPPIPSALAEFFGDHMLVNGVIWPRAEVEPRAYRLRLLNGCDSRFLVLRFRAAAAGASDLEDAGAPLPFHVVGSDQGLARAATRADQLLIGPGERYDVVLDFAEVPAGARVIMANIGGDAPFGGDFGAALPAEDLFPDRQTDRIMAFDVVRPLDRARPNAFDPAAIAGAGYRGNANAAVRVRKLALFEGKDEFGRLQPLLGTAEPTRDAAGKTVNGAIGWHAPTTENPGLGDTEIWEIYNATEDAHPVHLHLVGFEVLDRQGFDAETVEQPVTQHNGTVGTGFRLENLRLTGVAEPAGGVEKAPKDVVTALPGQVTRIKATFDKPGRYVWHCHILSHEDHEMMRVLHVGPGA